MLTTKLLTEDLPVGLLGELLGDKRPTVHPQNPVVGLDKELPISFKDMATFMTSS
jgi:hypothetical protein